MSNIWGKTAFVILLIALMSSLGWYIFVFRQVNYLAEEPNTSCSTVIKGKLIGFTEVDKLQVDVGFVSSGNYIQFPATLNGSNFSAIIPNSIDGNSLTVYGRQLEGESVVAENMATIEAGSCSIVDDVEIEL